MTAESDAPAGGRASRLTARVAVALAAVLLAGATLAVLVIAARSHGGPLHRLDVRVDDRLNGYAHRHPGQVTAWKAVTDIGGPTTWRILAGIAAIALWVRHRRRETILVAVAMGGAAALSGLIKVTVGRARPVVPHPVLHAGGGSFPSGHAMTSATAMVLLLVLLGPHLARGARIVLVAAAVMVTLAVGFSRLILGVHYVTDVLGGWLIAGLWLAAVLVALSPARRRPDGEVDPAR